MFFHNYVSSVFGPAHQKQSQRKPVRAYSVKTCTAKLDCWIACDCSPARKTGTESFPEQISQWPEQQRLHPLSRYCSVEVCTPFSTEQPFVFRQAETHLFINSYTTQHGFLALFFRCGLGVQGPVLFSVNFKPSDSKDLSREYLKQTGKGHLADVTSHQPSRHFPIH